VSPLSTLLLLGICCQAVPRVDGAGLVDEREAESLALGAAEAVRKYNAGSVRPTNLNVPPCLNPGPKTLHQQRCTLYRTSPSLHLHPAPSIPHHALCTLNPKPSTTNSKH
jgi:hypothetical protein